MKNYIFDKLGVANSSNPWICILHLIFKVLSIIFYLLGGWIFNSIMLFITVSIFIVIDFWIVKNLSGRILVGLRWWRVLKEDGNEDWKFESWDEIVKPSQIDSNVFWYS